VRTVSVHHCKIKRERGVGGHWRIGTGERRRRAACCYMPRTTPVLRRWLGGPRSPVLRHAQPSRRLHHRRHAALLLETSLGAVLLGLQAAAPLLHMRQQLTGAATHKGDNDSRQQPLYAKRPQSRRHAAAGSKPPRPRGEADCRPTSNLDGQRRLGAVLRITPVPLRAARSEPCADAAATNPCTGHEQEQLPAMRAPARRARNGICG
jgi:hypothetical protein